MKDFHSFCMYYTNRISIRLSFMYPLLSDDTSHIKKGSKYHYVSKKSGNF